jgi:transposase
MDATDGAFAQWLSQAQISEKRLTPEQRGLLHGAFAFRQNCGEDYYSRRMLSHFLLHSDSGLKVAQIARLVGFSRPTVSHQQGVSSKEAVQAAHHRMAGRPHGKMLPRYAGPIAEFILTHADATRYDLLEFIERTWGVRVSTVALHHFCKKFGLDRATRTEATASRSSVDNTPPAERPPALPPPLETVPPRQPLPLPPPPFSRHGRSTRGRSC